MRYFQNRFALFAVGIAVVANLNLANATCTGTAPCMGINRFELGSQFIQSNWGHVGEPEFDQIALNMSLKSINDATWDGIRFIRFAAGDFGPNTYEGPGILRLWKEEKDHATFFAKYDRLFDEADKKGIKLVPSLIWNLAQIPALAGRDSFGRGETIAMMMSDPGSRSSELAVECDKSFVDRYKNRESILFWELGNEWNFGADWRYLESCYKDWGQSHEICQPKSNYTTDQLIQFTTRLRDAIKSVDSDRKISTGHGYPTPYAQTLRQKPQWTWGKGQGLNEDKQNQTEQYLGDIHRGFELVSVHHYPDSRLQKMQNRTLLQYVRDWASRRGQELFVGEYGAPNGATGTNNFSTSGFLLTTLRDILALNIRWSAAWVYQFYQTSPTSANEYNIEQGMTNEFIQDIRQHTFLMEPHLRPVEATPPSLLITAPAKVETTEEVFQIYALAGDDSGKVESVKFLRSNGEVIGQAIRPPFVTMVNPADFRHGKNIITVEACDYEQNCRKDLVTFIRPGGEPEPPPPQPSPVTCELRVSPDQEYYDVGQGVDFYVISQPAGLAYRLIGTPQYLPSTSDQAQTPARIQTTLNARTRAGVVDVTRQAEILDQNGEVVCTTAELKLKMSRPRRGADFSRLEAEQQFLRKHQGAR